MLTGVFSQDGSLLLHTAQPTIPPPPSAAQREASSLRPCSSIDRDRTLVGVTWYSSVLPFDLYRKLLVIWNAYVDPLTLPHLFLGSLLHYAVVLETIQRDGLEPRGHFEVCSTRSSYRLLKISYAVVWFVVHWACRPKLITIHTDYIQILLYPAICSATILIDCHACHMNIPTCHS